MLRDMDLGAASRVRRAATDFVGAEIDGVMHMDQGGFHGLRGTGLQAWKRIDEGGAWTPLSAHLGPFCARFEGDTQTCLNGLAVLFDGPSTAEVAP